MSDTTVFGKTISATTKAMLLYATISICASVGGAMFGLDQREWDSWWWMKRIGWCVLQCGAVGTTIKAFYSNSSPAPATGGKPPGQ
jgi:hypothetical protein